MFSSGVCTSWKQMQWLPLPFLGFRQSVSLRSVEQVCLQFSVIRKWHLWAMVRQLCRPHTGLGFPSPGYMAVLCHKPTHELYPPDSLYNTKRVWQEAYMACWALGSQVLFLWPCLSFVFLCEIWLVSTLTCEQSKISEPS